MYNPYSTYNTRSTCSTYNTCITFNPEHISHTSEYNIQGWLRRGGLTPTSASRKPVITEDVFYENRGR